MSNYSLLVILLKDCYYSNTAKNILKQYNIPHQVVLVEQHEKDKFKSNLIDTFPQIYLKKNKKGNLLLGGCDNLQHFINTFKNKKLENSNIDIFIYQNPSWTKKTVLRLVELVNS
jgi:glutaredoxin